MQEESILAKDESKSGKAKFSKWRMLHAHAHNNIQPGLFGLPFLEHDMDEQIADALHLAELGLRKTPWKHGILNHASNDCRMLLAQKLMEWKHPLDLRRKDDIDSTIA